MLDGSRAVLIPGIHSQCGSSHHWNLCRGESVVSSACEHAYNKNCGAHQPRIQLTSVVMSFELDSTLRFIGGTNDRQYLTDDIQGLGGHLGSPRGGTGKTSRRRRNRRQG